MLPRALPEALLPKSRPSIGDLVLMPPSHKAAGKVAKVVGHYDAGGACDCWGGGAPAIAVLLLMTTGGGCETDSDGEAFAVLPPQPMARLARLADGGRE